MNTPELNTLNLKIILLQSAKLLVPPLWEPKFYILAGTYKPAYIRESKSLAIDFFKIKFMRLSRSTDHPFYNFICGI